MRPDNTPENLMAVICSICIGLVFGLMLGKGYGADYPDWLLAVALSPLLIMFGFACHWADSVYKEGE